MPGSEHALFLVINNVLFLEICSCFVTFLRSPEKKEENKQKERPNLLSGVFLLMLEPQDVSLFKRKKKKIFLLF